MECFLFSPIHDLLVEEIVHHHGRLAMTGAHGVVVANVRQSLCLAEGAHLHVKLHPVGAVFLRVDVMVELVQFGVMLVNPRENLAFVVATQIQVLQPDEVTAVLGLADDGFDIGDAGEYRRDETSGLYASLVELAHGIQAALDADGHVHLAAERLVERVDAPRHTGMGEGLDKVKVTQHKVRLCGDAHADATALKLFQQGTGALILGLVRLVAVGHGAEEGFLACILPCILNLRPVLHVNELAPRLRVVRKPLHKRGITVLTAVQTAHVGIHREVGHRQVGLRHHRLHFNFLYLHHIVSYFDDANVRQIPHTIARQTATEMSLFGTIDGSLQYDSS